MQATLAELAALVDGRLSGDGSLAISGAASLADARPGEITLIDRPERIRPWQAVGPRPWWPPAAIWPSGCR